jgi:hypothetical protein
VDDLAKKVDDLAGKVDDVAKKVDDSAKELHGVNTTQQEHSATLEYLKSISNNSTNRSLNTRRYKLFHKIELITSFRYNPDVGKCQWSAHPLFPKHLKAFRNLGNHTKGRWTASEQQLSSQKRKHSAFSICTSSQYANIC